MPFSLPFFPDAPHQSRLIKIHDSLRTDVNAKRPLRILATVPGSRSLMIIDAAFKTFHLHFNV